MLVPEYQKTKLSPSYYIILNLIPGLNLANVIPVLYIKSLEVLSFKRFCNRGLLKFLFTQTKLYYPKQHLFLKPSEIEIEFESRK